MKELPDRFLDMDNQILSRLDSLQEDVKEISQALVTLARIEERQATAVSSIQRIWSEMDEQGKRITEVEKAQSNMKMVNILWGALVVAGSIIGFLVKTLLEVA